jgi:hypothetical protein
MSEHPAAPSRYLSGTQPEPLPHPEQNPWTTLQSNQRYDNPWITVTQHEC